MLSQATDYGYGGYEQAAPAPAPHGLHGERPKLFALESALHQQAQASGHSAAFPAMPGYPHQIMHQGTPHHMQPHQGYDHEPLMMNGYYGAPQQVLQISTDYHSAMASTPGNAMPSGSPHEGNSGSKRSREELNLKEKKRMFKLNDRITQLKSVLEDAGVQTKKNKQSVLDNTYHYISMLRSNLLVAKQKAERAEKQAEAFKGQAQRSSGSGDSSLFQRSFARSTTPKLLLDGASLRVLAVNDAFLAHSGESEQSLQDTTNVRASLCLDENKLHALLTTATGSGAPTTAIVQARGANGTTTVTLLASAVPGDEHSAASAIEVSLVPLETPPTVVTPAFLKAEGSEASPSGVSEVGL